MQRLKKQDLDFACDAPNTTKDLDKSGEGLALLPDFSVDLIFQKAQDSEKSDAGAEKAGAETAHQLEEFIFPSDFSGIPISKLRVSTPKTISQILSFLSPAGLTVCEQNTRGERPQ
jgi:hypothetical protein